MHMDGSLYNHIYQYLLIWLTKELSSFIKINLSHACILLSYNWTNLKLNYKISTLLYYNNKLLSNVMQEFIEHGIVPEESYKMTWDLQNATPLVMFVMHLKNFFSLFIFQPILILLIFFNSRMIIY